MDKEVKYSAMIEQYISVKKEYEDYIVFYRVGDFYEMFFDDALLASKELELALTGKDAGVKERIPMCGVPAKAYEAYADKLVTKGYKVVICEQVEDPRFAKGLVKREVVKVLTPGIIQQGISEKDFNYIASIGRDRKTLVLCYLDASIGDGYLINFNNKDDLKSEIISLNIKEVVLESNYHDDDLISFLKDNNIVISRINKYDVSLNLKYIVSDIDPIYEKYAGLLINYFILTQKVEPSFFKPFKTLKKGTYLRLDSFTKKNLEIENTIRLNSKVGSLLYLIDKCSTCMGSRMMRKWLEKPLINEDEIIHRQQFIEAFINNVISRGEIKEIFKQVYDLERIIGRISSNSANAKDLSWLRRSLKNIPLFKESLSKLDLDFINDYVSNIDEHKNLYELLEKSIVLNPPLSLTDGGLIEQGFDTKLDEIRDISNNAEKWIEDFQEREREKTGIKNLKVGFNRISGYYIEINKSQIQNIPEDANYERRSTLVNNERFINPELKEYERVILNAKDEISRIEYEIFIKIRDQVKNYIRSLQDLADIISTIDCYISLAELALNNNYVKPTINHNKTINIVDGRHPVLETIVKDNYIVNDVELNNKYNIMLITGPNMSGKSTYMKMLAELVILTQIGSFVPAKSADMMIFDSIFTRIGASDDLLMGQSTFMVEMIEANYALSNATKQSLILFDEIGRGTATYDGMALAWAMLEYIHEKVGAMTLFSTHYHELTSLEKTLSRLKNVHVMAREKDGGVAFLHKVADGPSDKSYGINVASLAGLPKSLINRSKDILENLEKKDSAFDDNMPSLFDFNDYEEDDNTIDESTSLAIKVKEKLDATDLDKLSPRDALNLLYELREIK